MKNETVFLFPTSETEFDGRNDQGAYEVADIQTGKFLGVTGIRVPADDEYGYDAVYGWQDAFGVRSTDPYNSLSDSTDSLANHALTNNDED